MKRTSSRCLVLAAAAIVVLTGALGSATRGSGAQSARQPAPAVVTAGTTGASGQSRAEPREPVVAMHGMVASAHPLASEAGVAILRAGGNAVDAAVAAGFAIGVAEPNASGLGGEGMMVIYLAKSRTAVAIDYRSTLPATAQFDGKVPDVGYGAVAVPGLVAGLTTALDKYGSKRLGEVLAPAIKIADDGFVVSPTLASIIADNFATMLEDAPLAAIFCPEGLPIEAGTRLKNPDLASTLSKLASGGADVFYRGEIAERIARETSAHGGFMTAADLSAYRAVEREPVRGRYRGHEVMSAPPPVAGVALIETLQMLDTFNIASLGALAPARVHLTAEALKRAFSDYSAFVADPAFVKVPLDGLLAPAYARARAAEIRQDAVTEKVEAGTPAGKEAPSTTALAAIDEQGNVVVLTQTISDFFGAKVLVPGTGIILNNEVKNFGSRGINAMAPGKRMRTTIAPTIVLRDGVPIMALASPGAARIISTMALLISNVVDFGMNIQQAIDAPRFFARDTETPLYIEARLPAATQEALAKLGYQLEVYGDFDLFFGGAQGIMRDPATGRLSGGADPRRDGAVVGY